MLKGSLVALITPFRDGKVDEKAFQNFVDWQIEQGTLRVPVGAGRSTPINVNRQPALHRRRPTACQVEKILGWYLNGRSTACK